MQESVSGSTSHMRMPERAMKSKDCMIKSLQTIPGKKYHSFVAVGIVTRAAHQ